jgi:starch synthase
MPSSFEPCGISQMLAMRSGQPCVVHGVGGLADTVTDEETGFVFHGTTPHDQARALVAAVDRALATKDHEHERWLKIRQAAAASRFSWDRAAELYINEMYLDGNSTP